VSSVAFSSEGRKDRRRRKEYREDRIERREGQGRLFERNHCEWLRFPESAKKWGQCVKYVYNRVFEHVNGRNVWRHS
jgi:hypothetical protein